MAIHVNLFLFQNMSACYNFSQ